MGWFASLVLPRAGADPHDPRWWGDTPTQLAHAGVRVSEDAALRISAVFACVRVTAEDIGMLPCIMYRRRGDGGKDRAAEHPLYEVLHDEPNPRMSSFEFFSFLTACALLRGNGYAEIRPGRRGAVDTLWPLHPADVTPLDDGGRLRYEVRDRAGGKRILLQDEVFHLPGLTIGRDATFGVSVITYARETLGLALAAEEYGARFFSQDATPGGVVEHPKQLSPEAARRIQADWRAKRAGLAHAHEVVVLEEGMTYQQIGISNEDAEFLATRKHQIDEICRWFRMQPHKIAHLERATFSNIEHQALEHVTDTIMPWTTRWERQIRRQLLLDKRRYFAEFLYDALLRGDTLTRYQAYGVAIRNSFMSPNEARGRENMNPYDGGDNFQMQLSNTTVGDDVLPNTPVDQAGARDDTARYAANGKVHANGV